MANLKDLNSRILTLKNMQKVMRAMNMIATIKLRKFSRMQASLSLFERSVEQIGQNMNAALKPVSSPLTGSRKEVQKVHVVIFTADKGLCGAHNSSVQKALDLFIQEKARSHTHVDISCLGLKGAQTCSRKEYDVFYQNEIHERNFRVEELSRLSENLLQRFLKNDIQEIHLIGNHFVSTLQQETKTMCVIPLSFTDENGPVSSRGDTVIEPEPGDFSVAAGRLYLAYQLTSSLFHSYLSEQSARMTAMENATKNSDDLINHYVKLQNRARQAGITNDLIEIISGKEALKG